MKATAKRQEIVDGLVARLRNSADDGLYGEAADALEALAQERDEQDQRIAEFEGAIAAHQRIQAIQDHRAEQAECAFALAQRGLEDDEGRSRPCRTVNAQ
jgi:hypothetical protein